MTGLFSDGPIEALQEALSPAFDTFFRVVTAGGNGVVLVFLALVIYWVWDRRLGLLLGLLVLSSGALNAGLKAAFALPRPSASLHLTTASGYGFPSGHTQQASTFWGALALQRRGGWILLGAIAIALVALSRVYLGVHFVGDVLGGVGFGLAIALGGWALSRQLPWSRLALRERLALAVLGPAGMHGPLFLLGVDVGVIWGFMTGWAVGHVLQESRFPLVRASHGVEGLVRLAMATPILAGFYLVGLVFPSPLLAVPLGAGFGLVASLLLPWGFHRVRARLGWSRGGEGPG